MVKKTPRSKSKSKAPAAKDMSAAIAEPTISEIATSGAPHRSLIIDKLPGYFLMACLLTAFGYLMYILSPFLTVIFIAAVLTVTFYPVYQWLLKYMPNWERAASLITCFFVLIVTLAPLTYFTILLVDEAANTYELIDTNIESGVFDKYLLWEDGGVIYDALKKVDSVVDFSQINLKDSIVNWAQTLSTFLASQLTTLLAGISNLMLNIFIMLFSMFYFFKDGKKLVDKLGKLSPLPSVYESQLFLKVKDMVKAIVVGVFLTAIVQGIVGGIGFTIVGISSPLFWATAMALFSLVPLVGTAVIWVPAGIILAILGHYWQAIFIMIWGVVLIGSVDNFLRPFLIGGKTHTYPLMTFFVILGGIFTMGFKGIIIGPIILVVLLSFLHIYQTEYYKVLKS